MLHRALEVSCPKAPTHDNQGNCELELGDQMLKVIWLQKFSHSQDWFLFLFLWTGTESSDHMQCLPAATLSMQGFTSSSRNSCRLLCWVWDRVGRLTGSITSPGRRIHRLKICRGVRPPPPPSILDMTVNIWWWGSRNAGVWENAEYPIYWSNRTKMCTYAKMNCLK